MIVVGITGGIGSGKSTVCKLFHLLGIPVYYADQRARVLCNTHPLIIQEITQLLGEMAYIDGQYNRGFVAQQVFNHPELLAQLNRIVHPRVAEDFEIWKDSFQGQSFVIKEAAILFESGGEKQVDRIITVTAPVELRISRVVKRDHLHESEVMSRINNQWSDEYKIEHSHFVIHCDEKQLVIPQVLDIYNQLK